MTVASPGSAAQRGRIEIRLQRIEQLFNSFDPSPFREKDLDGAAEEFIVSWAQEFPSGAALRLIVHLPDGDRREADAAGVEASLSRYFAERADHTDRQIGELFRVGRRALVVGVSFLVVCTFAAEAIAAAAWGGIGTLLQTGLVIFGWVANWRPAEIFLYDWWPLARRRNLYRRLAAMRVEFAD